MKVRMLCVMAIAVGFLAASCGGDKPIAGGMKAEFEDAPAWVKKGCSGLEGDQKDYVCGVGSATGTRNVSLARSAAMGRARTDIARSLELRVKAMLKDYAATTTGGADFGTAAADEQHIVDVSKQVTSMTLSGTEIKDTWVSNTGTIWTLVVLDVNKFKDMVNGMKQLSEGIRKAIVERAENEFKKLDEEVEKQENQ